MFEALLGGAISGIANFFGTQSTNKANKQMAREQMAFQENMSNTAYQRGMEDMKAAGLNPLLAAQVGGATTPQGAMATMQNAAGNAVNSAMSTMQTISAMENQAANTAFQKAETLRSAAQTQTEMQRPEQVRAEVQRSLQEARTSGEREILHRFEQRLNSQLTAESNARTAQQRQTTEREGRTGTGRFGEAGNALELFLRRMGIELPTPGNPATSNSAGAVNRALQNAPQRGQSVGDRLRAATGR